MDFKDGEFKGQGTLERGLFMRTAEERWIALNCVQPFSDKGYHQTGLASQPLSSYTVDTNCHCNSRAARCLFMSVDIHQTVGCNLIKEYFLIYHNDYLIDKRIYSGKVNTSIRALLCEYHASHSHSHTHSHLGVWTLM